MTGETIGLTNGLVLGPTGVTTGSTSGWIVSTNTDDEWLTGLKRIHYHAKKLATTTWGDVLTTGTSCTTCYNVPLTWSGTRTVSWTQTAATTMLADAINIYANYNVYAGDTWVEAPKKLGPKNHRGEQVRRYDSEQLFTNVKPAELIALQLLRKMVPQDSFRQYLRDAFLSVRGSSGLTYQVFRSWGPRIKVWHRSGLMAELCIHIRQHGEIPPTDEVVAKMLMIEYDEAKVWERSNITWYVDEAKRVPVAAIGADITRGWLSRPNPNYTIGNTATLNIMGGRTELQRTMIGRPRAAVGL